MENTPKPTELTPEQKELVAMRNQAQVILARAEARGTVERDDFYELSMLYRRLDAMTGRLLGENEN